MKLRIDATEFTRLLWLSGHAPGLSADLVARRYLRLTAATTRTSEWVGTMFKVWDAEASKIILPVSLAAPE